MVSIRQISCATRQKLGNLRSQTGNFVAQESWPTKLLNFVACLTSALTLQSMCSALSTFQVCIHPVRGCR